MRSFRHAFCASILLASVLTACSSTEETDRPSLAAARVSTDEAASATPTRIRVGVPAITERDARAESPSLEGEPTSRDAPKPEAAKPEAATPQDPIDLDADRLATDVLVAALEKRLEAGESPARRAALLRALRANAGPDEFNGGLSEAVAKDDAQTEFERFQLSAPSPTHATSPADETRPEPERFEQPERFDLVDDDLAVIPPSTTSSFEIDAPVGAEPPVGAATEALADDEPVALRVEDPLAIRDEFRLLSITTAQAIRGPGDYEPIRKRRFRPGQPVFLYGELSGFVERYTPTKDGPTYLRSFSGSMSLVDPRGRTVDTMAFLSRADGTSTTSDPRELMNFWARYTFPRDLQEGRYELELVAHDLVGRQVARAVLSIAIDANAPVIPLATDRRE